MEFTETSTAGLKREYRVIVPASDLEARVNERLDDLKNRVQLRGFRPGKVPVAHLKRLYGKSAMAEVIEATVNEANSKIIADKKLKLAIEPKVVLPTEQSDVEKVIEGKSDLAYTVEMEIVPPITLVDFKSLKLTRLTAEVTDQEIDQAVTTIAEQNKPFVAKTEGAANGDRSRRGLQRKDGLGPAENDLRSRDPGQYRGFGPDLFLRHCPARSGGPPYRHQNVDDGSRLRHGQRAEGRRRE